MTNLLKISTLGRAGGWELDDGELLAVDDVPVTTIRDGGGRESVLRRLPARRAHDLSRVLHYYTRVVELFDEASHISGDEDALSSALHDASVATLGQERDEHRPEPHRVSTAPRLRAMAAIQEQRPWLNHDSLVGVVDAAARWLDEQEDYLARGVLEAAAGEEVGAHAWLILLDLDRPSGQPTSRRTLREERGGCPVPQGGRRGVPSAAA
jgi:hypothetical protein